MTKLRSGVLAFFMTTIFLGMEMPARASVENPDSLQGQPLKTGLTLSGGGAKGLAHIGVLSILDSLGIRPQYITGTSMGSIIGGMYASGYSARQIEEFADKLDWSTLFSTMTTLNYLPPQEREFGGKGILEVSVEHGKIKLPSGAIEGQQLWNVLNEIFLPDYAVTRFDQLPIPFACIATNVENGNAVVMRDGNLTSAIRASMAIPSVFTFVDRDGMKLIDGGVVNNFPVDVARHMGADFVIGVNVSAGLRKADELKTPFDIIYQMGFYADAQKFAENKRMTDLFIEPDLTGFSAASFSAARQIIERGKEAARKSIPALLALKSRLGPAESGSRADTTNLAELLYVVDSIRVSGNSHFSRHFIQNKLGIRTPDSLKASNFTSAINRLYATNYFERVNYFLQPARGRSHVILVVDVNEKPLSQLMAGINFTSFTGIGIIAGWRTSRLLINNATGYARFQLGKYPAFNAGIAYYLNNSQRTWLNFQSGGFAFRFPVYTDLKPVSEYSQGKIRAELSLNQAIGKNSYFSAGTELFHQSIEPKIITSENIKGNNTGFETFAGWKFHTLNQNAFPESGLFINLRLALIHDQNPTLDAFDENDNTLPLKSLDININTFLQLYARGESYIPYSNRLTQIIRWQLGYNFDYSQSFINDFNVGGTQHFLDKQFDFAGLNEYELVSSALASGGFGYQFNVDNNMYASAIANAGMYDFDLNNLPAVTYRRNVILGAALGLGYLTPLGPVEFTVSYSPQTDKIIGYVNLGWTF